MSWGPVRPTRRNGANHSIFRSRTRKRDNCCEVAREPTPARPLPVWKAAASAPFQEVFDGHQRVEVAALGDFRREFARVDERCPDRKAARRPEPLDLFADFVLDRRGDRRPPLDFHDMQRGPGLDKQVDLRAFAAFRRIADERRGRKENLRYLQNVN